MERLVIQTPIGRLAIEAEMERITAVYFTEEECCPSASKILQRAGKQLQEYFAGERKEFDLPLCPKGTAFQQKAWQALCSIPYGEKRTYGWQAAEMGSPKAARAVGGTNHKNPIVIVIPCHRVVAANGIGGYGAGVDKKEFLLALEKQYK